MELLGLYFADAGQHLEHRLFVDHAAPHCRSTVTYKGALQGEGAHTVWVGDVLIRAAAEGTDTYELNRNLVLTDGARADSVPNLEIETGEIVGAGHASATGRFDDEQLFYLQARGIPEEEARRLVVRGFFAELIQQIGVPELEDAAARGDRGRARRVDGRRPGTRCRRGPAVSGAGPQRVCAVHDVPVAGALRVVLGVHPGRRRPRRGRRPARDRRHLHPRRGVAVRGRGRRLHDRVLAARLALRPAHRATHALPAIGRCRCTP